MNIHTILKHLTVYVRIAKGQKEALLFYMDYIQPIKEYFGGDEVVKKMNVKIDN